MQRKTSSALNMLRHKLEEAKLRNPNWSMRAFAQKLGVSSGALSEMLAGKRPLSLKTRQRLIDRLQLSPLEQRELLNEGMVERPAADYVQLDSDSFHLISDWWHFAILNLVKTSDFRPDIPWLAERLGLSKTIVKEAWSRLIRLGYLGKDAQGRVRRRHPRLKTTDDILDLSIRRAHLEDLKLVEKALLDVDVKEREITSVTLALKVKDINRAKDSIRRFRDEFCELIERDTADDVYRLSIAFYPLTRRSRSAE